MSAEPPIGPIGMAPRVSWGPGGADELLRNAQRWRDAGATHLSVNTMGSGLRGLDAHLDALSTAREALQQLRRAAVEGS